MNEEEYEETKNIAIDFDNVIHNSDKGYHDGTIYGEPLEGVEMALKHIQRKGYNIIVFTCKANEQRPLIQGKTGNRLVREWLDKYELSQYITKITDRKPRAKFYIDDKAIKFKSWEQTLGEIGIVREWITDNYIR